MWWVVNKEGERVFACETKEEAKSYMDSWYTKIIYAE